MSVAARSSQARAPWRRLISSACAKTRRGVVAVESGLREQNGALHPQQFRTVQKIAVRLGPGERLVDQRDRFLDAADRR